jgi:mannose-1-phosphate guanylyltransferase
MDPQRHPPRYALILAGGSGQRFWPLSRESLPKQLLRLFGDKTLLEMTVQRLDGLVPKENILVLTSQQQEEAVRRLLPELPPENILAEPEKRDTAPAIALGVGWVVARDPGATMLVLPADHLIGNTAEFQRVLAQAARAAEFGSSLVTVGITPTWPCPSYGYIERGKRTSLPGADEIPLYEVARFREKPNPDLAEHFLSQGGFTWNAGMFIWSIPAIFSELTRHCPVLADFISELRNSKDFMATVRSQYHRLPKLSIDYALMERASRVLNIEATFDWDDVGNWTAVGRHLNRDTHGNQHNGPISTLDAAGNLAFTQTSQHLALLGVQDLIVVATPDALLVTHRSCAENIKKLTEHLPSELQ